jgi:hypothetical protein
VNFLFVSAKLPQSINHMKLPTSGAFFCLAYQSVYRYPIACSKLLVQPPLDG